MSVLKSMERFTYLQLLFIAGVLWSYSVTAMAAMPGPIAVIASESLIVKIDERFTFSARNRKPTHFAIFLATEGDLVLVWQSKSLSTGDHDIPLEGFRADTAGDYEFLLVASAQSIDWEPAFTPRGLTLEGTRQPPPPTTSDLVTQRIKVSVYADNDKAISAYNDHAISLSDALPPMNTPKVVGIVGSKSKGKAWVSTGRPRYEIGEVVTILVDSALQNEYEIWLDAPGDPPRILTQIVASGRNVVAIRAVARPDAGKHRLWLEPVLTEGNRGIDLIDEPATAYTFFIEHRNE